MSSLNIATNYTYATKFVILNDDNINHQLGYIYGTTGGVGIGVFADTNVNWGYQAGSVGQGSNTVALGNQAGQTDQGDYSIAVGLSAGQTSQSINCIAIGVNAAEVEQTDRSIAIGGFAGRYYQGERCIAIGDAAGLTGQQNYAIAIGAGAGAYGQGENAIAIGQFAGITGQVSNSVVINASGDPINGGDCGLYIAPIRSDIPVVGATGTLVYDNGSKEIYYDTAKTFVIDHPVDTKKYLVHACLEGPEAGVYYRGRGEIELSACEIVLPDYVGKFAVDLSVHVTPVYKFGCSNIRNLICSEVEDGKFAVHGEPGPFNWLVMGSRGNFEVEPVKVEVSVKGEGPYKYL